MSSSEAENFVVGRVGFWYNVFRKIFGRGHHTTTWRKVFLYAGKIEMRNFSPLRLSSLICT